MKARALVSVLVVGAVAGYVFLQADGALVVRSVGPSSSSLPDAREVERWTVEHVVDGDSFRAVREADVVEVRMAQIDAPGQGACWGAEARNWLVGAIDGELVTLEPTELGPDTDQYDRLVREVVLDGTSMNEAAVAAGMAEHREEFSNEDPSLAARLSAAENAARQGPVGLWANC